MALAQDIFADQCKDEPEAFQEPCDRAVPCEGDASQPVKVKEEFDFNVRLVPGNALRRGCNTQQLRDPVWAAERLDLQWILRD